MAVRVQRRSRFSRALLAGAACIVFGATLLFAASGAFAATYFSRATANWAVATTWSTAACGGTAAAAYPVAGDTVTICSPHTVTVAAAVPAAAATLTVNSGATLTQSGTLTVSAGSALNIAGTLTSTNTMDIRVPTTITGTLNIASTTGTHTFRNPVTISAGGTWNSSVAEAFAMRTDLINNGTFTSGAGTYTFSTTGGQWAGSNGLTFTGGVTVSIGWTNNTTVSVAGTLAVSGVVTVTNNATVTASGALTGSVAGSTWTNAANSTLNVAGALLATAGTILNASASGNTVNYSGAAQTVKLPSGTPATYYNLSFSGSGAKTMPATAMTISNDFITSGTISATAAQALTVGRDLTIGSGTTFNGATFTHNVARNFSNSGTFTASTSTVNLNGTVAQAIGGTSTTTFNNLTVANITAAVSANTNFNTNGTLDMNGANTVLTPAAAVVAGGTGTLTGTGTVQVTRTAAAPTFNAQYTITNKTLTNLTVEYVGTAAQQVSNAQTYPHLKINNASGVTLTGGNVTVSTLLTLTSGAVTTGANTLITTANCPGSVSRTGGHVAGFLRLQIPTGSPTCTFDVGDSTTYRPVNLTFSSVTAAGNLTGSVSQAAGEHPNISTSGIDSAIDVNRYWTLTNSGVVLSSYDATFNFVAGDVDGGADPLQFEVERWDGGAWNTTTAGTRTSTSTQATGITAFGDFACGKKTPAFTKLQILVPGETAAPGTPTGKTGTPIAQTAGTPFTVTVNAVDANWNLMNTVTDTVGITSSDVNATLPLDAPLVAGTRTFSVTLNTAGSRTVTATDITDVTKTPNTSSSITVNAGPFVKLQLLVPGETAAPGTASGKTGAPNGQVPGGAFTVTVNAVDANWNLKNTVTDTVRITSSDAGATLPLDAALLAGSQVFSVTLNTEGTQTVTATDVTDGGKTPDTSSGIRVFPAGTAISSCTPASASSFTWSHTTAPGADRILIVGVSIRNSSGQIVSTGTPPTYATIPLTLVGVQDNGTSVRVELWRLVAPALGANNVVVTLSAAAKASCGAISLAGFDQGSPIDATAFASSLANFDTVWDFNNPAYTDLTTAASNATAADVSIFRTDSFTAGDIFYVGRASPFSRVEFNLSTLGAGVTLAAEYWNGSAWTALSITDNTISLTASGDVRFTPPGDWATTAVNASTQYWVRFKTTTDPTTAPVGTQVRAQAVGNPTVTITTVANNAWVVDAIAFRHTGGGGAPTGSPGSGQAQHWSGYSSGGGAEVNVGGKGSTEGPKSPAGAVVMDWTLAASTAWAAAAVSLKPVAPPPPVAGGFNAYETSTAGGAITGVIRTKIAGASVSLDMIALNVAKTAIETTFTGTVRVEVLNASDNSGALDGNGCRPSWTVIQTLSPDPAFAGGDLGRKTISFTQANAYPNARLKIYFPVTSPTVMGCSNDNFAIRPSNFSAPTSTFSNSGTTGTPLTTAGGNFDITVVAIAGYNGTPTLDNTKITAHAGAVQNGSVAGSFGAANPATGTANGSTFTYSEVGNFTIGVNGVYDSTFTAVDPPGTECTNDFSNTLVGGLYGCKFGNNTTSAAIGRFRPDHFIVTLGTLTNRQALSCAPASTYTYEDEQLRVTFMLTARNGLGAPATTQNYTTTSGFAKLDGTVYTNFGFGAVDLADATPPLTATALTARVPSGTSSGTWVGGIGNFTVDLAVSRAASPDGPFESFRLGVLPVDADGVTLRAADLDLDTTVPANGNDRILLGSSKIRFGRLAVRNANGSQLVPLPVPLETQYWNGTAFITNTDDNCTSIVAANVGLGNYTGNLNSPETTPTISGAFSSGRKNIVMSAPGAANNGSVDVVINLGSTTTIDSCLTWSPSTPAPTGANMDFLRGQWCGATYTKDPTARATFGVYRGAEEVIFIRENF